MKTAKKKGKFRKRTMDCRLQLLIANLLASLIFEQILNTLLNNPKVAVVILNWNGRNFLEQFLPSVLASTYNNMEVFVADNGSTDDSLSFLKKQFPQICLIAFPVNYGFARGYNEALKQVNADYYVLLNSDVEVKAGWLEPMVELLQKIILLLPASLKFYLIITKICLTMPVQREGGWINMDILLEKAGYSMYAKKITGSMINPKQFFGQVGLPCSYVPGISRNKRV